MSTVKRTTSIRSSKSPKQSKEDDSCSRVGAQYQVEIPDFVYSSSMTYENTPSGLEVNVWNPNQIPIIENLKKYLLEASKCQFSEEAARVLLHYHNYNTARATIDLSNYELIKNTWGKAEVKKFLKCVDGRPRKNFVNVKKSFPSYRMGEVQSLYYGIAAPFKAISRHNKRHCRQIQSCYEKAVKCGFIVPQKATTDHSSATNLNSDAEEAEIDRVLESHLSDMFGDSRAKSLLSGINKTKPAAPLGNQNGLSGKGLPGICVGLLPDSIAASSDHSSSDPHSQPRETKRKLPPGVQFNVTKFMDFCATSREDLQRQREDQLSNLAAMDEELQILIDSVDTKSQEVIDGIEKFIPECGFPKVSYRWTKLELALFVIGLSKYGDDFERIARVLGTKTMSFLHDFYLDYNERLGLDAFIGKKPIKSEDVEETENEAVEIVVMANNQAMPTEVMTDENPEAAVDQPEQMESVEVKQEVPDSECEAAVNGDAVSSPSKSPPATFKEPASVSEPTTSTTTPVKKTSLHRSEQRQPSLSGDINTTKMATRRSGQSSASSRKESSEATPENVSPPAPEQGQQRRSRSRRRSERAVEAAPTTTTTQTRSMTPKKTVVSAVESQKTSKGMKDEEPSVKPKRGRPSTKPTKPEKKEADEETICVRKRSKQQEETTTVEERSVVTRRGRPPKAPAAAIAPRAAAKPSPEQPSTKRLRSVVVVVNDVLSEASPKKRARR